MKTFTAIAREYKVSPDPVRRYAKLGLLSPGNLAIAAMGGAALYYLWVEHRNHLIYFLPYLSFLLCPFIHFFMHREHKRYNGGHHTSGQVTSEVVDDPEPKQERRSGKNTAANIKVEKRD